MADKSGQTEFNPRHRILGAVILVTLAVILLPMILREQPPPKAPSAAREIMLPLPGAETTPAPGTKDAAPPPAAIPPPPEPDPAVAPKTPSVPPPAAAAAPTVAPAAKPAVKPAEKAAEKKTAAPAPIQKGWVIQVGAFSRGANAEQLRDRLRKQGYKAETESITIDQGTLVRVVVGPYGDKAEAKRARDRLSREQNLKGVLIAWPTRAAERKP